MTPPFDIYEIKPDISGMLLCIDGDIDKNSWQVHLTKTNRGLIHAWASFGDDGYHHPYRAHLNSSTSVSEVTKTLIQKWHLKKEIGFIPLKIREGEYARSTESTMFLPYIYMDDAYDYYQTLQDTGNPPSYISKDEQVKRAFTPKNICPHGPYWGVGFDQIRARQDGGLGRVFL